MNKVVCNICGTSYPESATQCPICGNVQNTEKGTSANSNNGNYTYVKGGRFSKANVKRSLGLLQKKSLRKREL